MPFTDLDLALYVNAPDREPNLLSGVTSLHFVPGHRYQTKKKAQELVTIPAIRVGRDLYLRPPDHLPLVDVDLDEVPDVSLFFIFSYFCYHSLGTFPLPDSLIFYGISIKFNDIILSKMCPYI